MSPDIEADFLRELALLEAGSLDWLPLKPGVYLHVSGETATDLVVGVPEAGAAVLLVG